MAASRSSKRGRVLLVAALAALTVAILFATGFAPDLMMVLPAPAIAALFLAWPHPGLKLILRIAARRRRRRLHHARRAAGRDRQPTVARGGRLLAASLGGRAPPALALRS
ncbi:MAG TPA: hypothetical protein VHV53_03415 [Solirubrobacterales bacterium]|jgi:hypothetical protein|nr:hypothetical protein [Solirubrobacterales bacterium]